MDKDGYPEQHELDKITNWHSDNWLDLMQYIKDRWTYAGYWRQRKHRKDDSRYKKAKIVYNVSTAGWSGNESIIRAMMNNRVFLDYVLGTIAKRWSLYI